MKNVVTAPTAAWRIHHCVFDGDPPPGGWQQWFDNAVAQRNIEGLQIRLLKPGEFDAAAKASDGKK